MVGLEAILVKPQWHVLKLFHGERELVSGSVFEARLYPASTLQIVLSKSFSAASSELCNRIKYLSWVSSGIDTQEAFATMTTPLSSY